MSGASDFTFTNNEVHDLFVYSTSTINLINSDSATISGNIFYSLAAIQGGAISLQSCKNGKLTNNTFMYVYAQTCGAICHIDGSVLSISDSTFNNTLATLGGGAIGANRLTTTLSTAPYLEVSSSKF